MAANCMYFHTSVFPHSSCISLLATIINNCVRRWKKMIVNWSLAATPKEKLRPPPPFAKLMLCSLLKEAPLSLPRRPRGIFAECSHCAGFCWQKICTWHVRLRTGYLAFPVSCVAASIRLHFLIIHAKLLNEMLQERNTNYALRISINWTR